MAEGAPERSEEPVERSIEQWRGRWEGLFPKKEPLVLLYTGNGKGKTTSALGVTMRVWGRGWDVVWLQFIKSRTSHYGETRAAERMGIEMIPLGDGFTWLSKDIDHDIALARECWALAREKLESGRYDLVVLDEITYPITYGLAGRGRGDRVVARASGERARHPHGSRCGAGARDVRGPRDGDDRGQAPVPARPQGAAGPRLLSLECRPFGGKVERAGRPGADTRGVAVTRGEGAPWTAVAFSAG